MAQVVKPVERQELIPPLAPSIGSVKPPLLTYQPADGHHRLPASWSISCLPRLESKPILRLAASVAQQLKQVGMRLTQVQDGSVTTINLSQGLLCLLCTHDPPSPTITIILRARQSMHTLTDQPPFHGRTLSLAHTVEQRTTARGVPALRLCLLQSQQAIGNSSQRTAALAICKHRLTHSKRSTGFQA